MDQRRVAANLSCNLLRQLQSAHSAEQDVLILGGDFNDDYVPVTLLSNGLGLQDVFTAVDCPPPVTHPTRPSHPSEERQADHTLDWILARFPLGSGRVISAHCRRVRGGSWPPPSDHMPVLCVCELDTAATYS